MKVIQTLPLFILLSMTVLADTHYVKLTGGNTSPYTSWGTAATSIQDAVNVASPGDTVMVDSGTYDRGYTITLGNTPLIAENSSSASVVNNRRKHIIK